MPDHANRHPSGSELEPTRHRFGTRRLRELLARRGDAGLWLAEDDDGGETLLRLYPGLPTMGEWHGLDAAASQRAYVVDPRLVPIEEIGLDVWPHLTFACADAESLARRIARAPMAPEAALAMCVDVAAALAALERAGVPPVDIGPADIVLVGERARLLPDVGLPGGAFADACVDLDHVAPERAAAIADRRRGARSALRGAASPTAESMTYALASIASAALHGPPDAADPAPTALSARLEQVLLRGLAQRPSERYGAPAALVEALGDAIGVRLPHGDASPPRATRPRSVRAPVARRRTRLSHRGIGIAIPAAVLLVAAALGTVAGSPATAPAPPAAVRLAGAGLSIEMPQGWLRAGAGDAPPAFGTTSALVAQPAAESIATALVVTRAAAPPVAQLTGAARDAVRLGDYDAWHYRDVAVGAGSVADVYVLEDDDGPIVAACVRPSETPASVGEECSAALTTVRLAGRAAALGGDAAARRELAGIVANLDQLRARARRALAVAATSRGQAAAADRVAAAYARAAAGAARSGTAGAPGDLARLVHGLNETGRAYAALATAARTTRRTAYAQAREAILAHERALHGDLAALAAASSTP